MNLGEAKQEVLQHLAKTHVYPFRTPASYNDKEITIFGFNKLKHKKVIFYYYPKPDGWHCGIPISIEWHTMDTMDLSWMGDEEFARLTVYGFANVLARMEMRKIAVQMNLEKRNLSTNKADGEQ